eukprot:m.16694 g.16694  ORF g.16694 m.16694 type:complete len:267 (-) comp4658_c0_seq1:660-1460(-)
MDKNSVYVITGASRGLGQAIAVAFDKHCAAEAKFVLTGTNAETLAETRKLLKDGRNVSIVVGDVSTKEGLEVTTATLLKEAELDLHSKFVVVNNAGTLGPIEKKCVEYTDVDEMQSFFLTNLTAPMYISSQFLRASAADNIKGGLIVNISSLFATIPGVGFGMYCTSRAARDMYTSVLSTENKAGKVRFLSYAPGPLDTDMQTHIRQSHIDENVRGTFSSMKEDGKLVAPIDSAQKLWDVIVEDDFKSGIHIDFFDKSYEKEEEAK